MGGSGAESTSRAAAKSGAKAKQAAQGKAKAKAKAKAQVKSKAKATSNSEGKGKGKEKQTSAAAAAAAAQSQAREHQNSSLPLLAAVSKSGKRCRLALKDQDADEAKDSQTKSQRREPEMKEPAADKVKLHFKAPTHKAVDAVFPRAHLKSDFFEAKLERWTPASKGAAIIVELPPHCDPERGATTLRARLAAAAVGEDKPWTAADWWHVVRGDDESLLAALCLFDLVLLGKYCEEVSEAIEVFDIQCTGVFGTIAKRYRETVCCDGPSPDARTSPITKIAGDTFHDLLQLAVDQRDAGSLLLVDRIIAGYPEHYQPDEDYSELMSGFQFVLTRNVFQFQEVYSHWDDAPAPAVKSVGTLLLPTMYSWLKLHVKNVIRACPETAEDFIESFTSTAKRSRNTKLRHYTRSGGFKLDMEKDAVAPWDEEFGEHLAGLLVEILHTLLKQSYRTEGEEEEHQDVLDALEFVTTAWSDFGHQKGNRLIDLDLDIKESMTKKCSPAIFAIAPAQVQRSILQEMLKAGHAHIGWFLFDHAHLVHPMVRHILLKHLDTLSLSDRKFLATATFPGLVKETSF